MSVALREPLPTERTLLQGVGVARWAAWGWLAITTTLQRHDLRHPVVAMMFAGLALVWSAGCTTALARRPGLLLSPGVVVAELVLAWSLIVADGYVFSAGHTFARGQNLAGTWPLIAVLSAATAIGPWWGGGLAALVGSGRYFGAVVNGVRNWPGDRIVSLIATMVFYAVGAGMWGLVTHRLRDVENEVAMRRARDEVARTLHDGVLQTLALVERRTGVSDPELARMARTSDRELRAWLFHGPRGAANADGTHTDDRASLEARLRRAADRVSDAYDLAVTVSVLDDDDHLWPPDVLASMAAAAGEALTNAAKHAEASRVIVFAEVDNDQIFVTVRDDGRGFDPTIPTGRRGIEHSIRQRMIELGGRMEIVSAPGSGTDVRLWAR